MKPKLRLMPLRNWRLSIPVEHPGLQNIAVIQRGMQMGVLALQSGGQYVQVNGDIIKPLNTAQVLKALRSAGLAPQGGDAGRHAGGLPAEEPQVFTPTPSPHQPVIVRRKRRTYDPSAVTARSA